MADEAQIAELSQKMISEREKLLVALESVSEDDASRPPSNRYHIVKAEEWKELLS